MSHEHVQDEGIRTTFILGCVGIIISSDDSGLTQHFLPSLQNEDRFINVEWEVAAKTSFIVRMKIITEDRKNILRDITESIAAMSMNIKSIDMRSEEGMGSCILILETRDTRQLARLKKQIQKIPNVIDIERI